MKLLGIFIYVGTITSIVLYIGFLIGRSWSQDRIEDLFNSQCDIIDYSGRNVWICG